MTPSLRSCAILAVLTALVPTHADADVSKAWTAAKDNLPGNARALVAVDVAAAMKTASWAKLVATVTAKDKDIAQGLAVIKSACNVDALASVSGFLIAGDPETDKAVLYVQTAGIDRSKFTSCIESVMKAMKEKVASQQDGVITSFTVGQDSLHVAWVAADVLAISLDPEKKADLQAWTGQKAAFARSALVAQIAKVDLKSIAWGAFALNKPLDDDDLKVVSGYGTATYAKGKVTANLRATFADAASATLTLAKAKQDLVKEAKRKRTPPSVKKLMKAIELTGAGADVVVKGSLGEHDLLAAFVDAL